MVAEARSRRKTAYREVLKARGIDLLDAELAVNTQSPDTRLEVPGRIRLVANPPGAVAIKWRGEDGADVGAGTYPWLEVCWGRPFGSPATHLSPHTSGCLDEFLGLEGQPPERVLSFAQKWGVLDLCSHGSPV